MKIRDFDYHLPAELIAQHPCHQRDRSRLMVIDRKTGEIEDRIFSHLPEILKREEVLVINDSRVIPARLVGQKETGGRIELLLLTRKSKVPGSSETWEVLLKPAKRVSPGTKIMIDGNCEASIVERASERKWIVTLTASYEFQRFLEKHGRAPLPPYIKRKTSDTRHLEDLQRYQTIYAKVPGSVAAPTAGLHFSRHTLDDLKKNGVHVVPVTLHVGYGTFLPIEEETVENHMMEEEFYEITPEAARIISEAESVTAVGTTATRVIESAADETGKIKTYSAYTSLFIYPGYRFKRVNALITNFHLPRSSLYLLVCAFAGKNIMEKAYKKATEERYRFYSYGDCMLIL
ncbi:MAG: tRNA preQ1(34) S-adenosylmethionine ribosyltransferase-isomerase QueA [Deltaproteobacteria bacterium]|nr:tRNA preQ1(34) S-adenosylmethionine ribosyltransferase-isomerase QueA [Deltaproteobacteria bacterium]